MLGKMSAIEASDIFENYLRLHGLNAQNREYKNSKNSKKVVKNRKMVDKKRFQ